MTPQQQPIAIKVEAPQLDSSEMHLVRAKNFQIANAIDYTDAVQQINAARAARDRIEKQRVELKAPILEAGRKVDAWFKPHLSALDELVEIYQSKVRAWNREQERIAAERQRQADEQARLEREQKEREAEEARKKQVEAQQVAAAAQVAQQSAQTREEKLAALVAQRRAERASEAAAHSATKLEQQAATIVAPKIEPERVKVAGAAEVTLWKWRLKDITKLEHKYLVVNETLVNKLVTTMKAGAQAFIGEGIEVYTETTSRRTS